MESENTGFNLIKIPYKVNEGEPRKKARRSYYLAQYMSVYQEDKLIQDKRETYLESRRTKIKGNE